MLTGKPSEQAVIKEIVDLPGVGIDYKRPVYSQNDLPNHSIQIEINPPTIVSPLIKIEAELPEPTRKDWGNYLQGISEMFAH